MSTGIMTDYGEEYVQKLVSNNLGAKTTWTVGLYNDSTDGLSDSSDVGAITTEPTGASYAKQSVSLPGDATLGTNASTNVYIELADQTFDVSDSSQSVDAYFIVVSFTSDVINSESSDNDHLLFNGSLNNTLNLSNWASYTARNIRGVLD